MGGNGFRDHGLGRLDLRINAHQAPPARYRGYDLATNSFFCAVSDASTTAHCPLRSVFINAMPSLCEVYTEGIVLFDHRCG